MSTSTAMLERLYPHLCLVDPLPARLETNAQDIANELCERLSQASRQLGVLAFDPIDIAFWENVKADIDRAKELHTYGVLHQQKLRVAFRALSHGGRIILHVAQQNAGILIQLKNNKEVAVFEAFEVAARAESTLASSTCLCRDFPGVSAELPLETFNDADFQAEATSFIERASMQAVAQMLPKTWKAGVATAEIRDTPDPALITDIFMGVVETLGRRTSPTQLRKSVWDCVLWGDGARVPWRRSPLWLTLRVGLQRMLYSHYGPHRGYVQYKFLMCLLLAQFLDDTKDKLHPTLVQALVSKLGRRLSKIRSSFDSLPRDAQALCESLAEKLDTHFISIISAANSQTADRYRATHAQSVRRISRITSRPFSTECELELCNSLRHLEYVMYQSRAYISTLDCNGDLSGAKNRDYSIFSAKYRALADTEDAAQALCETAPTEEDHDTACNNVAMRISRYIADVGTLYNADALQTSCMLLTLMELWVAMDKIVTKLFPLLLDFAPGFPTGVLHKLQLEFFRDFRRVQAIEQYLDGRNQLCKTTATIFADPYDGCFAEQWFDHGINSVDLQQFWLDIQVEDVQLRDEKEKEYEELMVEYRDGWTRWLETDCTGIMEEVSYRDGEHERKHIWAKCPKHAAASRFMFLSLKIYERMLPKKESHLKSLLVEYLLPQSFLCYRDTTWKLISQFGRPRSKGQKVVETRVLAWNYGHLASFPSMSPRAVTLGSMTKSFDQTHYKLYTPGEQGIPKLSEVCKPNGMRLRYCLQDSKQVLDANDLEVSFNHLFVITFPPASQFASLQYSAIFDLDGDGPDSNQIIAAQTKCPSGTSMHEFKAFLALVAGNERRWFEILVAMGSTDLNFSNEAVAHLMTRQVLQIGQRGDGRVLRVCHFVFQDKSFCDRLLQQLRSRISNAAANWRETTPMDLLLTIALRLHSLSDLKAAQEGALMQIHEIRQVTWRWTKILIDENLRADSTSSALTFQRYCRAAALICRRTFAYHIDREVPLQPQDVRCFLEASLALQDSLPSKQPQWPPYLYQRLVKDAKLVQQLRNKISLAIERDMHIVIDAIAGFWTVFSNIKGSLASSPQFDSQNKDWVTVTTTKSLSTAPQVFNFNWMEGHLFVNGVPVGSLPPNYRAHAVLNELFGEQILRTFLSNMPGMSYELALTPEGNHVHLGFRNGKLVVRTWRDRQTMEFVNRETFRGDLPLSMIDNCTHWLNVHSGLLEVRRDPLKWKARPGNWLLDVNTRKAYRRESLLVDPTYKLDTQLFAKSVFGSIAKAFEHFERPENMTVWLPSTSQLRIKLDRLDLTFFVGSAGSLVCEELQAEVDSNQDSGTWYGLESMLVMRSVKNKRQRSILVPRGDVTCEPRGKHVQVRIEPVGAYCRYTINEELGRIDSPPEPRFLYLKALLHAYTSRAVPDGLTGRTGTEEALHCLRSGLCCPYQPLDSASGLLLAKLAALSPVRLFYPKDLKVLETVTWDKTIPAANQDEAFTVVVNNIRRQSDRLASFAPHETLTFEPRCESHLGNRALQRRRRYTCFGFDGSGLIEQYGSEGAGYDSRDTARARPARTNMLKVLGFFNKWPASRANAADLAGLLNEAPCINGFQRAFSGNIFDDCLTADISLNFGPLVRKCHDATVDDRLEMIFLFSSLSYRHCAGLALLELCASFAMLKDLKSITLPDETLFSNFSTLNYPTLASLASAIETCAPPYVEALDDDPNALKYRPQRQARAQRESIYKQTVGKNALALACHILKGWPDADIDMRTFTGETLIDPDEALLKVAPMLQSSLDNIRLSSFVQEVTSALRNVPLFVSSKPVILAQADSYPTMASFESFDISNLCIKETAVKLEMGPTFQDPSLLGAAWPRFQSPELENIVRPLVRQSGHVRRQYARDLLDSVRALSKLPGPPRDWQTSTFCQSLESMIPEARQRVESYKFLLIGALLNASQNSMQIKALSWLEKTGMLPRMTPVTLLEQLQSVRQTRFGTGMKEALVAYGVAVTALQRLLRINDALVRGQHERRRAEIFNSGHDNWSPLQLPDWLLLEIETNILMRPQQVEVARATISPESSMNSLLQLQMGQGKSLCIVPAVAAALADKKNLVRVIVPRPLLTQTARELQKRLGGLLGRYVIHVPFSRRTPTTGASIREYLCLHSDALAAGGIEVAIPEHIMSFKLSGQQRLADSELGEATQMIQAHQWLQQNCRDVLDESDHILAPKMQLIYPGGAQMAVDGSPRRWEIAQVLLQLIAGHLDDLKSRFGASVEVVQRPQGGLPFMYFLRRDAEEALIGLLVKDAERGAIPSLPLSQATAKDRLAVVEFLSKPAVRKQTIELVENLFRDNEAALEVVYFLRGCLVHRLLLLTLKKRFHVNYGMHPTRPGLSVPYQYKGVPSDTAEWGHPDVAIMFTCLSFYYQGLNGDQLRQSLQVVATSDNPAGEYDNWIHHSKRMPLALRDWNGVNIEDAVQMAEIHAHVKFSMPAANHFLNTFVFPKHAKQFSTKLHASAWDIPLSSRLSTGFSGTADGKYLFPFNICQRDLPALAHTDAEVLSFLLEDRNREYVVARAVTGKRLSEFSFLQRLTEYKIRVLIDAGAQIMEMDNLSLIQAWMKHDHEAKAGVFFDAENAIVVKHRNGKIIPLSASPFAEDLSECVVYFAQANCRGSDVPLPLHAHAALTLSLGQTKDATVQAAMRLRQLGTTQSLTWFATPEVDQSIRDHQRAQGAVKLIDSATVISWLLQQTCEGIEALTPLFYSQGKNFCERTQAEITNASYLTRGVQRDAYLNILRQPERQTLKHLYAPRSQKQAEEPLIGLGPKLAPFMKQLVALKKSFDDQFGSAVHSTALEEVEVEREYAYEVEQVREAQKPVHFKPLKFTGLHANLKQFIRTGKLPLQSTAADLAFDSLKRTGPGKKYGISSDAVSSQLFASVEFSRTVEVLHGQSGDNFLRQPKYILYSQVSDVAILVSPEEAELLLKLLRVFVNPHAHLLTFAAPVTRRMLIFNDLQFFNYPSMPESWSAPLWLKVELGLFAGKLYFGWDEYDKLAQLLGVRSVDGESPISKKPISLMQDLLDLRRKGHEFYNTPIGYITQGKKLEPGHSFFMLEDQAGSDESHDAETVASDVSDEESKLKDDLSVEDLTESIGSQ